MPNSKKEISVDRNRDHEMKRSVTELGNGRNVENLWGNGT